MSVRGSTRRPAARGFTLIELVMVIGVLGVLAAVAVPRYTASLARYRVEAAAGRIVGDLERARAMAGATSARVGVRFDTAGSRYIVSALDGVASLDPDGELNGAELVADHVTPDPTSPDQAWVELGLAPFHAELTAAVFGKDSEVFFDGFGRPDRPGRCVVTVGAERRRIVVDDAGRISTDTPAAVGGAVVGDGEEETR